MLLFATSASAQATKTKFDTLAQQINTLYAAGDCVQASALANKAAAQALKELGAADTTYLDFLYASPQCAQDAGDYAAAKTQWESLLSMESEAKHPLRYADICYKLAACLYRLGDFQKAENYYLKTKKILEEKGKETSENYIELCSAMGVLYRAMGDHSKATALYEQALRGQKTLTGKEHKDYALILNNLATLRFNEGDYPNAEQLNLEALGIRARTLGKESKEYASSLNNLAVLYENMHRYSEAEALLKEALELRGRLLGKTHPSYAVSLNNIASIYEQVGRYEEAERAYLESSQILKTVLGEDNIDYAFSLSNLGALYYSMKHYEEAEKYHLQAQAIIVRAVGKEHSDYAINLNNLALLYLRQHKYAESVRLYEQSASLHKTQSGERHPNYLSALANLAEGYYLRGDTLRARQTLQEVLLQACDAPLSLRIDAAWADSLLKVDFLHQRHINIVLAGLEVFFTYEANHEQQQLLALTSTRLLQKSRERFTQETEHLRLLKQSGEWLSLAMPALLNAPEKAFELAQFNKSALLQRALQGERLKGFGGVPDTLIRIEQRLQTQQQGIRAQLLEQQPKASKDSLQRLFNDLNLQLNTLQERIQLDYPKYAALQSQAPKLQSTEIQKFLPPRTALIEYVLTDSGAYAFYIDKSNFRLILLSPSPAEINAQIDRLHKALSDYEAIREMPDSAHLRYTTSAHWCYAQLLKPLLLDAKDIQRLIIVPDGRLAHLPFEAFLTASADAQTPYSELPYLLHDFAISYNLSSLLWKNSISEKPTASGGGRFLALAADYSLPAPADTLERSFAQKALRKALKPLLAVREEVEMLRDLFPSGTFLFGADADEAQFKRYAADADMIHLAMHGILDEAAPLRSSLAMSESSKAGEDNFLYAYEISRLQLRAQLVVLSACETGYGKFEKGNGTASLARAFAYAGVPALLVSLWSVNDQTTALLMSLFYEQLQAGKSKDQALQEAKKAYLQRAKGVAAHPAFWSAFVQMGDSRPLNLDKLSSSAGRLPVYVVLGAAVLGLLIWLISRNRAK